MGPTKLSITGAIQNDRAQIIYQSKVRWVTARYLSNPTALISVGAGPLAVQPAASAPSITMPANARATRVAGPFMQAPEDSTPYPLPHNPGPISPGAREGVRTHNP